MMLKKVERKMIYFEAFVYTMAIFLIGFELGHLYEQHEIRQIESDIKKLKIEFLSNEVIYLMMKNIGYNNFLIETTSNQLYDIGEKLERLENTKGCDDPEVIELKEKYFLLEIRHWLLMKEYKNRQGGNYTLILYFYSNKNCDKCTDEGIVLSYIKKKYPNEVFIYSFDTDYKDFTPLVLLERVYNITKVPSVVINDVTYSCFLSLNEIENIIH